MWTFIGSPDVRAGQDRAVGDGEVVELAADADAEWLVADFAMQLSEMMSEVVHDTARAGTVDAGGVDDDLVTVAPAGEIADVAIARGVSPAGSRTAPPSSCR